MRRAVGAGLALVLLAACGDSGPEDERPQVVAAFYPLAYLAEQIGGGRIAVTDLTPAGAEPHDIELRPSQAELLSDAGLTLYLKGFQPAVDAAVRGDRAFDLTTAVPGEAAMQEQGKADPHVWLDPVVYERLAAAIAARLTELSPGDAGEFNARAAQVATDLGALDAEFRAGLADCDRHELVTSHAAFGYLARRYGLTQIGIAGISPDEEPTSARLSEIATLAREKKVTTIFFETLVSPKLAETVADEIGVRTAVLDPIESKPERGDYLTSMRANLAALRTALGCR